MNTKQHYKITTVLFVLILICLIADLAWTILHPRPTRFLWFVVLLYFTIKLSQERDPEKCIWRQEYKRKKEQAEEAGISYQENRRVVRTPKMYLIEIPLILVLIYVFLYIPNTLWPYRASWEYKGEIAWYKNLAERLAQEYGEDYDNEVYETYKLFPDTIPKEAKCVKWSAFQSFQGGYVYLSMKMPREYIQNTIKRYGTGAKILYYDSEDEEWWWEDDYIINESVFPGISSEDKEAENVVIYLFCDGYYTDYDGYGFWVNEKENVICFFGG